MTDYKRVLWSSTPKDRAELADLERKGVEYTGLGTAKKAGHNPPKLFELDYYDGTDDGDEKDESDDPSSLPFG